MRSVRNFSVFVALVAAFASRASAEDEVPPALARWLAPQAWERDVDGPIVSLGKPGEFDDMHIFAPAVANENGGFQMWYPGSRGARNERVFRLGLATSNDGKRFEKHAGNPVLEFPDGEHSVLTPALLRNPDGTTLRENGKLRMWVSSARLGKSPLHTLHETTSDDGIHWAALSSPMAENVYCPTVLKTERGYEMWFSDVSKRPWLIRHAVSSDGTKWAIDERPVLQLNQPWEVEILVYPTVLKIDGVYLMWYGSYYSAVRRQTTAIGFAASIDGVTWHKHPQNPVIVPDVDRPWESNYVGSGCVMRLADGSFRYWYASRTKPPFVNLYFAINTASWGGPPAAAVPAEKQSSRTPLSLPPKKGEIGVLQTSSMDGAVDILEIVDEDDVIVRAWYLPSALPPRDRTSDADATFVDLWLHGVPTGNLTVGSRAEFKQSFEVTGNKSFDTTCGSRSVPLLEVVSP